jgi:hypothetical protein
MLDLNVKEINSVSGGKIDYYMNEVSDGNGNKASRPIGSIGPELGRMGDWPVPNTYEMPIPVPGPEC